LFLFALDVWTSKEQAILHPIMHPTLDIYITISSYPRAQSNKATAHVP